MSEREVAIRVAGLGKRYRMGALRPASIREVFSRSRGEAKAREAETEFWALRDVSFDVNRGEVVGIIGRNGAGKSTLLKILSRITEPTEGRAEISGRIGSLLEVGTGFHPDLSGRENVLLNGAILGMRRIEIERKFDEIAAFAEVERFLDTPVKHYSSGMYMRLAFAVAAHLDPEILVIDEVLAVGDEAFQRKCLGKMEDISKTGRTVLFVSHNLGAVASLCGRAICLSAGHLVRSGSSEEVISHYLASETGKLDVGIKSKGMNGSPVALTEVWLEASNGTRSRELSVQDGGQICLTLNAEEALSGVSVGIRISTHLGQVVCSSELSGSSAQFSHVRIREGLTTYSVRVPGDFLAPGSYFLTVGIHRPNVVVLADYADVLSFSVLETGSDLWMYRGKSLGCVMAKFHWRERSCSGG